MTATTLPGPSATAQWEKRETGTAGQWPPLSLLLLPDVSEAVYHALLERPAVWRDRAKTPVFTLTLVLERAPRPTEPDVRPLVTSGFLAFDLTAAVPAEVRGATEAKVGRRLQPLFARRGQIRLTSSHGGGRRTLAAAELSGTTLRAALTAPLNREEALEVLDALDGKEALSLRVSTEVAFRAASGSAGLTLSGYWAEVYDFLAALTDEKGELTLAALREAFEEMLRGRVIDVSYGESGAGARPSAVDASPLFAGFMRSTGVLLAATDEQNYRLRRRPHPVMRFEYRDHSPAASLRTRTSDHSLDQILGNVLAGSDPERHIRHVCPDSHNGGGLVPAPRSVSSSSSRAAASGRTQVSAAEGSIKSMALAMRPSPALSSAHALAYSDMARPQLIDSDPRLRIKQWQLDDLVLDRPGADKPRSLPVVDNPDAPLWKDRLKPNFYWYAPKFTLTRPAANADPASSPFLFTYRRTGTLADGRPALKASIRLTCAAEMTDAQKRSLEALPSARAAQVPLGSLSAVLSVPYIDERDGKLRRTTFQAAVKQNGNVITATVDLINDSVRLAYGALAVPGFQSEAARLEISFSFEGYRPLQGETVDVVAGGKIAVTPIAYTRIQAGQLLGRAHVNAEEAALDFGAGEIKLRRETPRSRDALPPPVEDDAPPLEGDAPTRAALGAFAGLAASNVSLSTVAVSPAATHVAASHATTVAPALATHAVIRPNVTVHPSVVTLARPQITASAALAELIRKVRYATRTLVRQETVDALFPCAGLGSFYRQEGDAGTEAIGCVDALRLGQTVVRQYEEMQELAHAQYRVFRSLGQPGRFLVLPAAYRITRYAPSVPGKAYRPAVAVYSSIDVNNPANNRVIYHATLQPDIAPHQRRALLDRLRHEARDPFVEYPTEISAGVTYAWTVGGGIRVEPSVVKAPEWFQVTLATDMAGALLLRALLRSVGVFGSARLTLQDGTTFETILAFDLSTITGPWATGPLELTLAPASVTLRNAIERPVDVSELLVYDRAGQPGRIAVEASLSPNATHTVGLPQGVIEAYAAGVVGGDAADIEEIRSFIEDVQTNVVFINLVNFGNHALTRVAVEAQLKAVPGSREVQMSGDPPRGSLDFLLPLTTYLTNHVLQFRVTKTFTSGAAQTTPWFEWDLETNGNVVSLTWELIR